MNVDQIRALSPDLQPSLARRRFRELLRGGLPSNSLPGGSRGSETPLPAFDKFDRVLNQSWERYQSYLTIAMATSSMSRRAQAIHNATRIQEWFLLAPDPIPDVVCENDHCVGLLELGRKSGKCQKCKMRERRKKQTA